MTEKECSSHESYFKSDSNRRESLKTCGTCQVACFCQLPLAKERRGEPKLNPVKFNYRKRRPHSKIN